MIYSPWLSKAAGFSFSMTEIDRRDTNDGLCRELWGQRIMRKNTDLNQVKALAKTFLMLDIEQTEASPLVVHHPFTDSGISVSQDRNGELKPVNLLEDEKALRTWRQRMGEQIDKAGSAFHIHMMVTKPYRMTFLKHAKPFLSKAEFSEILSDAWMCSESPGFDPNVSQREQLAMFRAADPAALMDADEYERLCSFEDPVTIYRGVTSYNADHVKALSWTLNYDTVVWFANRFDETGMIYEAQIAKDHILAYLNGRNEQEVIVDPRYLMEISEAHKLDSGLSLSL